MESFGLEKLLHIHIQYGDELDGAMRDAFAIHLSTADVLIF
jgi:hypothetical protein